MHDPEQSVVELAEKLSSRNRHVIFLFGAGTSCAGGLPDLKGLKEAVLGTLEDEPRKTFKRLGAQRNLEQVLSRLRLISEVLKDNDEIFDSLSAKAATALDLNICSAIASVTGAQAIDTTAHARFARWAGLSRYNLPIEVFTTNYDLLIEKGLELSTVPYFDGFVGNYRGSFRADLIDSTDQADSITPPPRWVRVWKLHGSVSWAQIERDGRTLVVRTSERKKDSPEQALAIYPSLQKYQESRRIPFVVLSDRFRRALAVPETLCIVSGYSFGDEHVNELLFDAARLHRASEVFAFCHSAIPSHVAKMAVAIPNLTVVAPTRAIIGAVDAEWRKPAAETMFWKKDAMTLGDFAVFSNFLLLNAKYPSERTAQEEAES